MTGRYYTIDGERLPSVTTILGVLDKPGLATWRGRLGNDEADRVSAEARDHGTSVHAVVEQINLGRIRRADEVPEPLQASAAAYLDWLHVNVSAIVAAERLVVSRRLKYAGTADLIAVLRGDDQPAVIDLKTSKTDLARREWELQLGAYALALEEEEIECRRRVIVRIPKTRPGELIPLELRADDLERDQRAFVSCLKLWRWHAEKEDAQRAAMRRLRFTGSRP